MNILFEYGIMQHNHIPNRNGSFLDLVVTYEYPPDFVTSAIDPECIDKNSQHHFAFVIRMSISVDQNEDEFTSVNKKNYNKIRLRH